MSSFVPAAAAARSSRRTTRRRCCSAASFSSSSSPRALPTWRRKARAPAVSMSSSAEGRPADDDEPSASKPVEGLQYYRSKVDDERLSDERAKMDSGEVRELPLFPLGLVLQPGGIVPLHIFEMRYRLLFNRIQDGDDTFGLVFYNNDNNLVSRIGTAAHVRKYENIQDGRLLTLNEGKRRFRILRYTEEKPYVKAMVQFFDDDEPTESLLDVESEVWRLLQDVLRLSNKLYNKEHKFGELLESVAPKERSTSSADDETRRQHFSFAVNQVLDMSVQDQQMLLQTRDTGVRLRKQQSALEAARQYLAAQVTIKQALG